MDQLPLFLLRFGLGITFIITGIYIFKSKDHWTGPLPLWLKKLLPLSPERVMLMVAIFDVTVGIWLLTGIYLWLAALLATLHLIQVLIVSGINQTVYRDIGLLFAAAALTLTTWP